MKNLIAGLTGIFVIIFIGVGIYYFGRQSSSPMMDRAEVLDSKPVAEDSTTATFATPTPEPQTTTTITTPPIDPANQIKAALISKNQWTDAIELSVKVNQNDGQYASGTVNSDGGGGYFYAIYVDGEWQIVADGNGIITCSSLEPYPDYPKSMISDCYDETTESVINR